MSDSAPSSGVRSQGDAVLIYSVKKGPKISVRFLGPVQAIYTHWHAGESWYCPGQPPCPQSLHSKRLIYKGYAPVQVHSLDEGRWDNWLLEVTENLEELLRGEDLRGQVWRLWRSSEEGKKAPVLGVHFDDFDPLTLRKPFPVLPILERRYRYKGIVLDAVNTVPTKVRAAPDYDRAPIEPPPQPRPAKPLMPSREEVLAATAEARRRVQEASRNGLH